MANVRIKINMKGLKELRQSEPVQAEVMRIAEDIAKRANTGLPEGVLPFEIRQAELVNRGLVALVVTSGKSNRAYNAKHNTLLRAMRR